ncbi:MAG TPA: CO dehydrogenase/acetyl-CoA synthase complex subunit epsilon [Dehalococcoidia bacterium]|nr:CO dehydrogenase/acetyl-CoA synthase complex subunit epsilon [Dehalococcoidia bacterium]
MTTTLPYHRVNVLTGTKAARIIEDAGEYAHLIKRARRPLLVLGARTLTMSLDGRLLIEYAADIASAIGIPICATAHTKKKLLELGVEPASSYDITEIVNHLKDPEWRGVKKEGNHDLVMFLGFRTDFGEQALSTLKHYAQHLKTMTLCKYYYPHASYSLPNLKDEKWKEFLDNLITNLKEKEA